MKKVNKAWIVCVVLAATGVAFAQGEAISSPASNSGTPLLQLIETVAKKTGKTFIIDPRVAGNALMVGIDPAKVTYPELLTILQVQGFASIESGGYTRVVPDSSARTSPSPLIGNNEKLPDALMVTRVMRLKSIPSPQLVPILRALLPQSAHLAAFACTNELIIVDTFANVRRIETIVESMDKGNALTLPTCRLEDPRAAATAAAPAASPPPPATPPK